MSASLIAALGSGPVDVALLWSPTTFSADFGVANGDLATDSGLDTAVILSLFTDRVANADDVLPEPVLPGLTPDRRGWWGDLPADGSTPTSLTLTGSRLWLLRRALATTLTAQNAQAYCQEALAWMTASGVAASVTVATSWEAPDRLAINVQIAQSVAGGGTINRSYALYWSNT